MTKNIGRYTITLHEVYYNNEKMVNVIVYEFDDEEKPINNGKPIGDFYIHGKISECYFTKKEIERFISFPWHTQFRREYVAINKK